MYSSVQEQYMSPLPVMASRRFVSSQGVLHFQKVQIRLRTE
jgi:hypothetical protein